jgi:hypothetical protein
MAGVGSLPFTCAVGFFAVATALAIGRSARYRPVIWAGWPLTAGGIALLVLLTRSSSTTTWVGLSLVSGVGLGILAPALSSAAQMLATPEDVPVAVGLHSVFHCTGRAFGVAIGGTAFQNTLLLNFRQHPDLARPALEFAQDALAFMESLHSMQGGSGTLKFDFIDSYVDALRCSWIVIAALAGAGALVCVFGIRAVPARQEDEVDVSHEMKTFDEER